MMNMRLFLILLVAAVVITAFSFARGADYMALGTLFEQNDIMVIRMDNNGNFRQIKFVPLLPGSKEKWSINASTKGNLCFASPVNLDVIRVMRNGSVVPIADQEASKLDYAGPVAISPDNRFLILRHNVYTATIKTFGVRENDGLTSTGFVLEVGGTEVAVSSRGNTVITITGNIDHDEILVLTLNEDGRIEDTGQRIDISPLRMTYGLEMARNGSFALVHQLGRAAVLAIDRAGNVSYNHYIRDNFPRYSGIEDIEITNSSRYVIIAFHGGDGGGSVRSYRVELDFSLTPVDFVFIYNSPMELAITPDDNFVLVQHLCGIAYQQRLTSIRLNHDGTFGTPVTQLTMLDYLSDMEFIPPQVVGAYGVCEDEAERPVYMETFADWQGGSVPGVFDVPESWQLPDGALALRPTSTTNCFGFWQSPVDALMVVPYSVYRARFAIRASNSEPLDPERLPGLRLRTNAQTLQQANSLVLNSAPEGLLMPGSEPTTVTLFFEPPISSCSREETADDVFCSLDLMAFNADDDLDTTYVLSRMLVDRLPVECFDVEEVVRDYEFTDDAEGWTYGGAPGVFEMPQCVHAPGALLISAAGETNCFGFWNSDPADVVTSTAAELYRATFYVRTNQPDRWLVPTFRLRVATSLSGLITTQEIVSANDSEMSPYYDSSDPARQFEYPVYLYKPETPDPLQLVLAFDLLVFDETDNADTLFILDRVRLERLTLPTFPLDD